MIEIQQRIQRAAESILENEALTADLDDDAAKVLLDWGVTRSQEIASHTIEMDDGQAEEAMYRPMRALRKMLRAANKWVVDPVENQLERIVKEAPMVYGPGYLYPGDEAKRAFNSQIPSHLAERLVALRDFIEGQGHDPASEISSSDETDCDSTITGVRGD